MPIRGECRIAVAARQQGYHSGQSAPDGVIVAAAFAAVLGSVTGGGIAVVLRITGVVGVLDVLSELLDLVIHRG